MVRKVMNVTKHYIQGKRIRVELSRPRIEFSHQTKTVFVGGLEDGIDDPELSKYFSEFGFVTRALRIPNKDGPKRKFGKCFLVLINTVLLNNPPFSLSASDQDSSISTIMVTLEYFSLRSTMSKECFAI